MESALFAAYTGSCSFNRGSSIGTIRKPYAGIRERDSGKLIWNLTGGGLTSGQPAVDHETVYFGSGDGYIYAVHLQTGMIKWKVQMVSSDNAYSTLINSAWATHATVIPEQHGQPPIDMSQR